MFAGAPKASSAADSRSQDKTSGSMARLSAKFDLARLIAKHNDKGDDFHFDQIQSDSSFAFCSAEIGVIVFGINSLGSVFKQVSWSIVPNESSEAFAYAYNGIMAAFFGLFKEGAVRLCERGSACNFCGQLRDIPKSPEVVMVLNIVSNPKEELPVKRAG